MTARPSRPVRATSGFRPGRFEAALPTGWRTLLQGNRSVLWAASLVCTALLIAPAQAADPVTPAQRAAAQQVAQTGVPSCGA